MIEKQHEEIENGEKIASTNGSFFEIPWQTSETDKTLTISVNNPAVKLPRQGLEIIPEFISEKESNEILKEIYTNRGDNFSWEGFDLRRKVLRFSLIEEDERKKSDNDCLPPILRSLVDRIRQASDLNGTNPIGEVTIEEYPRNQLSQNLKIAKSLATTFETGANLPSSQKDCGCYVACLPLTMSLIEYVNRPKRREVNCFELHPAPENHSTSLVLPKSALVIKKRDFLFHWRNRIVNLAKIENGNVKINTDQKQQGCNPIVLLKFYGLTDLLAKSTVPSNVNFGYMPTLQDKKEMLRRRSVEMPKLEDLLTVVVTTSPVKSNPSTELLEKVFDTFKKCGHDFAYKCHKVIICDGTRQRDESTTKKHTNDKQSMRNGIVTADQNKNYFAFKQNLKQLCQEHGESTVLSPFNHTTVSELDVRQGYGFALRHALRECVDTPFVIVIQHDRTFMRPTPIAETIRAMWYNSNIKYVGMSMRSNLMMRDQFLGRYGVSYSDEMLDCILRPPELLLDAKKYGPNSESAAEIDYEDGGEKLRTNLLALAETYKGSQQYIDNSEWLKSSNVPGDKCQLSLSPTLFWYDNVHICETRHYRDFIFDPEYRMVVKGGFVEDKLSPVIKKTVERLGLKDGHSRFGCFLLDDYSGFFFTGHLDGGSYMTPQQKQQLIDIHRLSNAKKKKEKRQDKNNAND